MRLLMWVLTLGFAFGAMGLWLDGAFLGARLVALGLGALAFLACPFLWARPDGLVPDELAVPGKARLMLALALLFCAPLLLPWQLWL
ncbi:MULTISPECIES: hypothetical protein [unclassified Sphingobium]|uniref:hypothetical protein n=1 Tax=unclassified Sphingobium TaxID=2611147 RepID=UPI002223FADB|nr:MULTISPECIES: hypothetical protein [unclassified Sphingobium]MCW2395691.1 hypothetical protein [Sphingobium sp. B8D3B]MCW2413288.1 hypothetical protein [Sphingobium sp. B8D3D]MCW2414414.1 hypothetical protein [Sphingobium sp. B8D3A]MCW2419206.1 hypothetical protein [Sphingobium sp. B8D3C]